MVGAQSNLEMSRGKSSPGVALLRKRLDVSIGVFEASVFLRCAPTARFTSGGRFHPGNCRLPWPLTSGLAGLKLCVAQAAAKIVLEPIFEAGFEDSAHGYRPRRSAVDAVKETHRLLCRGYTDVVDVTNKKAA